MNQVSTLVPYASSIAKCDRFRSEANFNDFPLQHIEEEKKNDVGVILTHMRKSNH